jgi:hypothetical protein
MRRGVLKDNSSTHQEIDAGGMADLRDGRSIFFFALTRWKD